MRLIPSLSASQSPFVGAYDNADSIDFESTILDSAYYDYQWDEKLLLNTYMLFAEEASINDKLFDLFCLSYLDFFAKRSVWGSFASSHFPIESTICIIAQTLLLLKLLNARSSQTFLPINGIIPKGYISTPQHHIWDFCPESFVPAVSHFLITESDAFLTNDLQGKIYLLHWRSRWIQILTPVKIISLMSMMVHWPIRLLCVWIHHSYEKTKLIMLDTNLIVSVISLFILNYVNKADRDVCLLCLKGCWSSTNA